VYNFAAIADIADAKARAHDTVLVNVMGTTNAAQACVDEGVSRLVYASTLYVYSPLGSMYRATKQAAENILEAYQESHGLEYTLLRYGSLYGPRAQSWNGLKSYVTQVVRELRMRVEGDEQRIREYIHVEDAARLSVDILDARHANQAITITGSQVLTTAQLARMIFEIAGVPVNVEVTPPDALQLHYQTTPYRYTPKHARKLVPSEFVDIGQGILELVEEVRREHGLDV
jgi:UDP-glucose 4-epimerase